MFKTRRNQHAAQSAQLSCSKVRSQMTDYPFALVLVASLIMSVTNGHAQDRLMSCEQYAQDFANLTAPRSGGAALGGLGLGAPGAARSTHQRDQPRPDMEWRQMEPNRRAYRDAYDRCMANRR